MLLRIELGEVDPELAQWWTEFQEQPENQQKLALVADKPPGRPRRRRKRVRKKD
jgi:poly(A) polymerase